MTRTKIGFILCSSVDNPIPSTRIAVVNIMPFLQKEGFDPIIIFEPKVACEKPDLSGVAERVISEGCKVLVLQKVYGPSAVELVRRLSNFGIATVFVVCDRIDVEMASIVDETIVISKYLKSLYPIDIQNRIHVVHDGIENPSIFKNDWGSGNNINAVLVTSHPLDRLDVFNSPPDWVKVSIVGAYAQGFSRYRQIYWQFMSKNVIDRFFYAKFLANKRICCIKWSKEVVEQILNNSDIGIIPISTIAGCDSSDPPPDWKRKSENRLTLKMAAGLPVIATPIPSYEDVIDHGKNGYFAQTKADWVRYFKVLRDADLRKEIGSAARLSVIKKYSIEEQASKFIGVLNNIIIRKNLSSKSDFISHE